MEPSRWRCSSALGCERTRSESKGEVIRGGLMRQLRPSGIHPGCEPEGADVSCGVGELANQDGRGLIVEAIVVFVGEGIFAVARAAVRQQNGFKPTVRTDAGLKRVVRGVADKDCVIWPHGEKGRKAV